jgi:hypothetical protein
MDKAKRAAERNERLEAALRENLRRRKTQARERAGENRGDECKATPAGEVSASHKPESR